MLMVKLRGRIKQKTPKTSNGVVVSGFDKSAMGKFRIKNKRQLFIALALIVIILAGGGLFLWQKDKDKNPEGIVKLQTEQQAVANQIDQLAQNSPAENKTTKEKANYYRELSILQAQNGDYKSAASSLGKLQQVGNSELGFADYLNWAFYYHKDGQKDRALAALDTAEQLLPTQYDEATGFDPEFMRQRIDGYRQEYSK